MTEITPIDPNERLPIDASSAIINALTAGGRDIRHRFERAKYLTYRVRDDRRLPSTGAERDAAIAELDQVRGQLVSDFPVLSELIKTPAPPQQFKAIVALAARGYNSSDPNQWVAGVFMAVTGRGMSDDDEDPPPISAAVLAQTVLHLARKQVFRPSPAEVFQTCLKVRNELYKLREDIKTLLVEARSQQRLLEEPPTPMISAPRDEDVEIPW